MKRSCGESWDSSLPFQGENRGRHWGDVAVASLASTRTILWRKWRLASLEKRYGGRYRIVFCWQGNRHYHSLGKIPEREACSCLDRLEESLRFVDRGLLQVPPDEDLISVGFSCPTVGWVPNPRWRPRSRSANCSNAN